MLTDERRKEIEQLASSIKTLPFTPSAINGLTAFTAITELLSALDFAERIAADKLNEDSRYLLGWQVAREQAARTVEHEAAKPSIRPVIGILLARAIRNMQPEQALLPMR